MRIRAERRTRGRQAGLSLVELMVSMLLGLIVVAGLIQVLLANRRAYEIQQGNNILQQNLRFASDRMAWCIRVADFWGGARAEDVGGLLGSGAGASGCRLDWALAGKAGGVGGGVFGYDGKSSFPIPGCVPTTDYVAGSDVLVLRYVDTNACDVAEGASGVSTHTCTPSSHYLVTRAGQAGVLFAGFGSMPDVPGGTQRYVFPYRVEMYYLQPCSNREGTCRADSDDGSPQPTLMRMRLLDGVMTREPLLEGIEQLQFEYGVVEQNAIASYKSAARLGVADWPRVQAVRIHMVARSRQRDMAMSHAGTFSLTPGCSYQITNAGSFVLSSRDNDCDGFTLAGLHGADRFARVLLRQTIQVRNRPRQS